MGQHLIRGQGHRANVFDRTGILGNVCLAERGLLQQLASPLRH